MQGWRTGQRRTTPEGGTGLKPGEIKIEGLSKRYRFRSLAESVEVDGDGDEADDEEERGNPLLSLFRGRKAEVWALNKVSCSIRRGERVGIVGGNGSGKSTLIRILSRILPPSEGTVSGAGIVVPFGALKKPIAPQDSGCNNLRMLARLLDIPLGHLEERLPAIIEFSEIGQLAHEKVSRYSERSFTRLAMAMALLIDADIYLVDDDLKAGDEHFRAKFDAKLAKVLQREITLVYASNSLGALRQYCRRGLFLQQGRLVADGEINSVINLFLKSAGEVIDVDALSGPLEETLKEMEGSDSASNSVVIEANGSDDGLEPVVGWLRQVRRAEWSWDKVLSRWREGINEVDLTNFDSGVGDEGNVFGSICRFYCRNSDKQPVRRVLPGESLQAVLSVNTAMPAIKIDVRLEMHARPLLVWVSEPLIPFVAEEPGEYVFHIDIPGDLLTQSSERLIHKLRAVVTFGRGDNGISEQAKARVRLSVSGDVRRAFDEKRHSQGAPLTSFIAPAPTLRDTPNLEEHSYVFEEPLGEVTRAASRPALRPRLNWLIYRVKEDLAADARPAAIADNALGSL
jgi:ABC-2 type transport system ATP-binding protein